MLVFVAPAVYPNNQNPSAGIFIFNRYKEITKFKHKIVILDASAYRFNNWLQDECRHIIRTNDEVGDIYSLHVKGFMTSRFPQIAVRSYKKNLEKLYNEAIKKHGKPDILVAHFCLPSGFTALELGQKEGLPVVIVEHHHLMCNENIHPYIKNNLKKTVISANAFVCGSNYLRQMIEKHTNILDKIVVINNHIDNGFKYYETPKKDKFIFFSAGNLKPSKRFDLLITAFCKAFDSKERVELRIAGSGIEHKKLLKMILENGRSHQINLLGQLNSDEMLKEYIHCHCFILASEVETFGNVYREAMAVGRPVISAKNGGIMENWEKSFGILIDVNDVNGCTIALREMISNYDLYNKLYISNKCMDLYGINNTVIKFNKILSDILK